MIVDSIMYGLCIIGGIISTLFLLILAGFLGSKIKQARRLPPPTYDHSSQWRKGPEWRSHQDPQIVVPYSGSYREMLDIVAKSGKVDRTRRNKFFTNDKTDIIWQRKR